MQSNIFSFDDIKVALIEHYGILVVNRPVKSTDTADLFQYERVKEYVTLHSDKTAVVPA